LNSFDCRPKPLNFSNRVSDAFADIVVRPLDRRLLVKIGKAVKNVVLLLDCDFQSLDHLRGLSSVCVSRHFAVRLQRQEDARHLPAQIDNWLVRIGPRDGFGIRERLVMREATTDQDASHARGKCFWVNVHSGLSPNL
jgi:hypothetical protein